MIDRTDKEFDDARGGMQTAFRHEPAVVAAVRSARDVQDAVAYAAARRLPVAVQATGHGLAVPLDGGVLIATRGLTGVTVDGAARTAYVPAGSRWREVVEAAAPHGLAPPSGSAPSVGAIGYTVGGGVGLLARTVGYASDSVRAFDLVTADGELRHVTDGDLFWALRGGRDAVGVVTGMDIALAPYGTIYGGGLYFDAEFAPGLFERYREWSADLPDRLTTSIGMLALPPVEALPEPIRGRHVVHVRFAYAGPAAEGEKLVAPWHDAGPVLLGGVRELPYAEGGSIYSEPDFPHAYYGSNAMVSGLTELGLRRVVQLSGPNSRVPLVADLRQLGGALRTGGGAVPYREAAYVLRMIAAGAGELPLDEIRPALAEIFDVVADETLGRSLGFLYGISTPTEHTDEVWPAETRRRLAEIKAEWDPANLFRAGPAVAA
jgi:FAD binding domain-containing protein/berberine-like enzyme